MEQVIENKKERKSNIELLRIFCMVSIVAHHYVKHGEMLTRSDLVVNNLIMDFLLISGKIGVNCFVLVSGYFFQTSKFKLDKTIKLMAKVLLYSLLATLIYAIISPVSLDYGTILKAFFPITFSRYWFITTFIGLMFLTPYINILISNLDIKSYRTMLIILTVYLSILPTVLNQTYFMNRLSWFIYLYMVGGYIKRSEKLIQLPRRILIGIWACFKTGIMISVLAIEYIGKSYATLDINQYFFLSTEKLPVLICSVAIFLIFLKTDIKSNKEINAISSTTFGVYLLHDSILRRYIWVDFLGNNNYINSPYLLVHAIYSVVLVFLLCAIIDFYVIRMIETKFVYKLVDLICQKVSNAIEKNLDFGKWFKFNHIYKVNNGNGE